MFKNLTLENTFQNRFNLPKAFLWPVIILCILPSILVINNHHIITTVTLEQPIEFKELTYYNIWAILTIAVSLITGALSIIDYIVKKDITTPLLGGVLLCTGLFDIFPLLTVNKIIYINAGIVNSIDFGWFISRLFYALFITAGTWYFTKISRKNMRTFQQKNAKLKVLFTIFTATVLILIAYFLFADVFPDLEKANNVISHPFELILLFIYLTWGFFVLPPFLRRFPSIFSRMLILSVIPATFAEVFMSIHQQPFDNLFNTACFFRFISYLVPLSGICMNYIETSKKEKEIIFKLNAEVRERVEAQRALQNREKFLTNAETIAHLGSWELDTQSADIKWSDELFNIFGYDATYIRPSLKLQEDIIVSSYRDKVRKELALAIHNKTSFNVEYEIEIPSGKRKYLLGQGNCLNGNKLIGTVLDITELKEATQKLQKSEALLREAEAISHNGSWEWIPQSDNFYWSDELFQIHGLLSGSQTVTLDFYKTLIHPEDISSFNEKLKAALGKKEPLKIEYKIIRPNGEIRYLLLSGKFKTDLGDNVTVIGNIQDITELKNTSQQLDKSESIYRTIAKNVPDSIVFLFDKEGNLLLTEGPIVKKIRKELKDESVSIFQHLLNEEDKQNFEVYFKKALEGKDLHYENKLKGRVYKINFDPVHNSASEIFGVMIVMNDITDIKRAQNDLESKVSELNRSNNELEQFAYIASHDLQEPLRKIRAFGERLKTKFELQLPAEGQDYIARMSNASERMQILIDDLLTFSRISRTAEEFKTLNIGEIIRSVISDLELTIEKKKARIVVNANELIQAVPSQMRQLFQNLISNSMKFTLNDVEPEITIDATELKDDDIKNFPGLLADKEYCKIVLKDNGIGFDPQYKDKIFVLFQRLHTRNAYEGTGIGLAMCKKIVDNHSGIITAKGEEGKGASFTIILPREK